MCDDIEKELAKLEIVADSLEPTSGFIDKKTAVAVAAGSATNDFASAVRLKEKENKKKIEVPAKKPVILRTDTCKVWSDPSLAEWPENDFRIKVDSLHVSVTDNVLYDAFKQYKSLAKVHVVMDSSGRSRRYGFVSLLDVNDYIDAMKTVDNSFIGPRRVKLTPSKWKAKLLPK